MTDIEISAGGAHGAEGAGGDHIHLFGGFLDAFLFGNLDYLGGRDYNGFALFDFCVDFFNRFGHRLSQMID